METKTIPTALKSNPNIKISAATFCKRVQKKIVGTLADMNKYFLSLLAVKLLVDTSS